MEKSESVERRNMKSITYYISKCQNILLKPVIFVRNQQYFVVLHKYWVKILSI